jgi:lysozyme
MNTQTLAAALIRVFEGIRLTAYQDSGGVWTIGIGHTGPEVVAGLTITADQAAELFATDAAPLFGLVTAEPMIAAAAYVSFGYNCGRHTLEMVLAGQAKLEHYTHDRHGNELPGLVARRGLEAALIASVGPVTA